MRDKILRWLLRHHDIRCFIPVRIAIIKVFLFPIRFLKYLKYKKELKVR